MNNSFIVAWWCDMVTLTQFNIGSGNGLLPDGTKPLPEPMLTFISEVLWHSPESNFTVSIQAIILYMMSLKIILFKLLPHLPGANELKMVHVVEIHH